MTAPTLSEVAARIRAEAEARASVFEALA